MTNPKHETNNLVSDPWSVGTLNPFNSNLNCSCSSVKRTECAQRKDRKLGGANRKSIQRASSHQKRHCRHHQVRWHSKQPVGRELISIVSMTTHPVGLLNKCEHFSLSSRRLKKTRSHLSLTFSMTLSSGSLSSRAMG